MHYLFTTLALTAAVSAIDFRYYNAKNCNEVSYVACTNVQPGACCPTSYYYHGVSINAVPSNWNLIARTYQSGGCSVGSYFVGISRTIDRCLSNAFSTAVLFSGASYTFTNKKARGLEEKGGGDEEKCTSVQKPDVVALEDGQKYDISGLEDGAVKELVEFAFNGTTTEGIPAVYAGLAVEKKMNIEVWGPLGEA